jgi:hypothetical protein
MNATMKHALAPATPRAAAIERFCATARSQIPLLWLYFKAAGPGQARNTHCR